MSLREKSKLNYEIFGEHINHEEIKIGCLQRIADATELMAREYQRMLSDRNYFEHLAQNLSAKRNRLEASNRALRGVITRMKKMEGKS